MDGTPADRSPSDDDELKSKHVEGLELAWLHPPNIVSFFHGVPARAHEIERRWVDAERSHERSDHEKDRFRELLEELADQLANTVERVRAAGYPLNPSVAGIREPQELEPSSVMKRLYDGATEILRRLDGVAGEEWGDGSPDSLLGAMRSAVGEASWKLRRLNDGVEAMSVAPSSSEVTPDSAAEVIDARDGIEALSDSVGRPPTTTPHEPTDQET